MASPATCGGPQGTALGPHPIPDKHLPTWTFHYYTIVKFGRLWALTNEDDSTPLPPTDNLPCHFVSAFGAGFVTTVIASPVDVVKTRYMNSPPGQYRSAINCAWTMMTKEGPTAFYKGWVRPIGHLWTLIKTVLFCFSKSLSLFCSADLCHRFWGWGRGTSSCLSPSNKSREPWWSRKRRSKPKTEIPSMSCLMENLKLEGWTRYIKPQLLFCHDKDIPSRVWTFLCCISLTTNHFWTGKLHFNANLPLGRLQYDPWWP